MSPLQAVASPGSPDRSWTAVLDAAIEQVGSDPYLVFTEALDQAGSVTIGPDSGGEYSSNCPSPAHNGGSGDQKQSLRWRQATDGQILFHCLAGETRVVTRAGTKTLAELAGTEPELLVPSGATAKWQRAPVKSFGVQKLLRVTLSRFGNEKVLYATDQHRWFVQQRNGYRAVETLTRDLVAGKRLRSITPHRSIETLSSVGVAQGFVFGDGSLLVDGRGSVASFHKAKHEMLEYFPNSKVYRIDEENDISRVHGLPTFFKRDIPPLDEAPSYLYGWLAGYFAADGSIEGHTAVLSSSVRANLERVREIATRLGIVTYPIQTQNRLGINGVFSDLYKVTFRGTDLKPDFFVRAHHREHWEALGPKSNQYDSWRVVSVEDSGREEEVFCAVVEGAHAFALEDSILTGNCHAGCEGDDIIESLSLSFVQLRWSRTEYHYRSDLRELLAAHVRTPLPGGKKRFHWEHPENGVLINGRGPGWEPVLWCLPDLQEMGQRAYDQGKSIHLWLTEGERDAIMVAGALSQGWAPPDQQSDQWVHLVTTSADGAAAWSRELSEQVIGLGCAQVTIVCDSDEAGTNRGAGVADALHEHDAQLAIRAINWAGQSGVSDATDAVLSFGRHWLTRATSAADADVYLWCSFETGWLFEGDALDVRGEPTGKRAMHRMLNINTPRQRAEAITKWPLRVTAVTVDTEGAPVGWELDFGAGGRSNIRTADLTGANLDAWNARTGVFIVPARQLTAQLRAYLGFHGANVGSMTVYDHEGWVDQFRFVTRAGLLIGPEGESGTTLGAGHESGGAEWHYGLGDETEAAQHLTKLLTFRDLTESGPVLAWLASVAVRPRALQASGASFVPMLQVPGGSGVGKTSFLRLATRMFGLSGNPISNVTSAGLVRTLALTTGVVWIDDFTNYDDTIRDVIRGGLTGAGRTRGTTSSERGIVRDEAYAALINSGEHAFDANERAMSQRSVILEFTRAVQGRKSRQDPQTEQYRELEALGVSRDDKGAGLSRWAGTVIRGLWAAAAKVDAQGEGQGSGSGVRGQAAWEFVRYGAHVLAQWLADCGQESTRVERMLAVIVKVCEDQATQAAKRERSGADVYLIQETVPRYLSEARRSLDGANKAIVTTLDAHEVKEAIREAWRAGFGGEIDRPAKAVVVLCTRDEDENEEPLALAVSADSLYRWASGVEGLRAGVSRDERHISVSGITAQLKQVADKSIRDPEDSATPDGCLRVRLGRGAMSPRYRLITDPELVQWLCQ